jgi:hypothetical protein
MHLGIPQIIYLALLIFGLGISIAKHGKPRSNENFWMSLISATIIISLLMWGGFFK